MFRQRRRHLSRAENACPGGILVVVGRARPRPRFGDDPAQRNHRAGSYIYTDEFDRAIHLLATQQISVADLTTVISPLPDALTAFDELRAGQIMKALIAPGTRPFNRHPGLD